MGHSIRQAGIAGSLLCLTFAGCAVHRAKTPVAVAEPSGPVIVRLVGRHQSVIVTSSGQGPRYSVRDNSGKMLVANATLDQLRTDHPDVYRLVEPSIAVDASVETRTEVPAAATVGPTLMLDSRE